MKKRYHHAIVGGTFDRFHAGHKKLLDTTFEQSEHVTIGISTEPLFRHKLLANTIESYEIREGYIREYVTKNNFEERAKYTPIEDIYGTSLQDQNIDVIFVTEENKKAADIINEKRTEHQMSPLAIIVVPFVKGTDGEIITSERIRKGEIDREGNVYRAFFREKQLVLPQNMRTQLRNPVGKVITDIHESYSFFQKAPMVITVGDIVSLFLIESDNQADVSLIDLKTRRHELNDKQEALLETLAPTFVCTNKPGTIEKEAVEFISQAINEFLDSGQKQTIKITGEEDLLTLPAILLAPLGTILLYGQYDEGAVIVKITEQKKQEIAQIISKFEAN